jgi:hypothetical protein
MRRKIITDGHVFQYDLETKWKCRVSEDKEMWKEGGRENP